MAWQEIILGTPPSGFGGDPPRVASMKINAMTKELYAEVESLGSADDVVPIEKGGTGATTQELARSGLGLGSAAVANLVGTMASGAIIEKGSNANGNFIKFADGTMLTWGAQLRNVTTLAGQAAAWDDGSQQPAPFLAGSGNVQTTVSFGFYVGINGAGGLLYCAMQHYNNGVNWYHSGVNMGVSPSASHPSFVYGSITSLSYVVSFQSMGRWK